MPTTPYTTAELAEFKTVLDTTLATAEKDLRTLEEVIAAEAKQPVPDLPIGEDVTLEDVRQLAKRQRKFIQHLKDAQARIANKTYGICRVTGKTISKERLFQVPHATLCIEARASVLDGTSNTASA